MIHPFRRKDLSVYEQRRQVFAIYERFKSPSLKKNHKNTDNMDNMMDTIIKALYDSIRRISSVKEQHGDMI